MKLGNQVNKRTKRQSSERWQRRSGDHLSRGLWSQRQLNACFSGSHPTSQCTLTCLPLASCPKHGALRLPRNQHKRGRPPSFRIPHGFHICPSQLSGPEDAYVSANSDEGKSVKSLNSFIFQSVSGFRTMSLLLIGSLEYKLMLKINS